MIDHMSPRERADLERALEQGQEWPRVICHSFLRGHRLLLGIDQARSDREIAEAGGIALTSVRAAIAEAARWCEARGLHLLGFPADDAGPADPTGEWTHFMAVG